MIDDGLVDATRTRRGGARDSRCVSNAGWPPASARVARAPEVLPEVSLLCTVVHSSLLKRSRVRHEVAGYAPALPVAQDDEIWMRMRPLLRHGLAPPRPMPPEAVAR